MAKYRWLFATNNRHKLEEARLILAPFAEICSLNDLGIEAEVEESGSTFLENARLKAEAYSSISGLPCFADDSGLCVEALKGAPGVHSARFAGEPCNHELNNAKLLAELEHSGNRAAHFHCCIATVGLAKGNPHFEGRVYGSIGLTLAGHLGFGYDPLFIPDTYSETFAQLGPDVKNRLSHRALALQQMAESLISP
jgi:XTP/dITP diphosphohydrolase